MTAVLDSGIPFPPEKMRFMSENDTKFVSIGEQHYREAMSRITPESVLDIGCGYGRFAYALHRNGFSGRYTGIDILSHCIDWLSCNFNPKAPNFAFIHQNIKNDRYNKNGKIAAETFSLSEIDYSPDLIVLLSVFTHMYDSDISLYLSSIKEVMHDKSLLYVTLFLLDSPASRKFTFDHVLNEHCSYFSSNDPLHAIGYRESWLRETCSKIGLEISEVVYGFQDRVFLKKS